MVSSKEEALRILRGNDLLSFGMRADHLRQKMHPDATITYALRPPSGRTLEDAAHGAYIQGRTNVVLPNVAEVREFTLKTLIDRLKTLRNDFPQVTFCDLPISFLTHNSTEPAGIQDDFDSLHHAGLRSISVGIHPAQAPERDTSETIALLRAARAADIGVNVVLTIGESESPGQRVDALAELYSLQDATKAIQAVLVSVHHAATPEARREEEATAVDYLRTLAATRIFLENVEHVQTDWSVMGPKVLELALRFGADDAGSVPWSQSGNPEPSHHGGEAELRRIIRDAGFRPVERDALFRQSLLH